MSYWTVRVDPAGLLPSLSSFRTVDWVRGQFSSWWDYLFPRHQRSLINLGPLISSPAGPWPTVVHHWRLGAKNSEVIGFSHDGHRRWRASGVTRWFGGLGCTNIVTLHGNSQRFPWIGSSTFDTVSSKPIIGSTQRRWDKVFASIMSPQRHLHTRPARISSPQGIPQTGTAPISTHQQPRSETPISVGVSNYANLSADTYRVNSPTSIR